MSSQRRRLKLTWPSVSLLILFSTLTVRMDLVTFFSSFNAALRGVYLKQMLASWSLSTWTNFGPRPLSFGS
jgi:hypothetical protein